MHQHDKAVNPIASCDTSEDISFNTKVDSFSSAQGTDDVEDSYCWQDDDDNDDDDNDDVIGSNYEEEYDDYDDLEMNGEPTQLGNDNLI